ncbi:MAG: serine/threonine protein kinase [Polyangiaceae bacterium]|nr:serine/threonine protein kinase [Polyangiaceae bacterium]
MAPVEPGYILSKKYRLVRRLGAGGMGEVWEAHHERTHGEVAIKILLHSLAGNAEARLRFVREARATSHIHHPAIIRVFDAATAPDGRPYLVMELLRGESLAERLARERRMSPVEACAMFAEVARALAAAHACGICHRDLSTANVFLVKTSDGGPPRPKILDFGVSKITEPSSALHPVTLTGSLLGSPAYMSPEQAAGAENVDARSDVWSLGVLLYQSLTGTLPFHERTQNATLLAVLSRPHIPVSEVVPGLDRALADTVEGCLVKDVAHRFSSAVEVAQRLERVGQRIAAPAARALMAPRRRVTDRFQSRAEAAAGGGIPRAIVSVRTSAGRGVLLVAAATGVCGLLAGLGLGSWSSTAAPSPPKLPPVVAASAAVAPRAPIAPVEHRCELEANSPSPPTTRDAAPDLASAVAKGLGVSDRRR